MRIIFTSFLLIFFAVYSFCNVLIVKDGCSDSVYSYYVERMNSFAYHKINTDTQKPDLALLSQYSTVMWLCGESRDTLDLDEKDLLKDYMSSEGHSLFIEGDHVIYDAAFIDQGFFFRNIFDISYSDKYDTPFDVITTWSHPITWGLPDRVRISSSMDTMDYAGIFAEDAFLRMDDTIEDNRNSIPCIGVASERYRNRAVLLSFSPATRDIWDLDVSDFVINLVEWLDIDNKRLIECLKTENRYNQSEKYSEIAASRIVIGLRAGDTSLLDDLIESRDKIPDTTLSLLREKLTQRIAADPLLKDKISIIIRIGLI
ncbi:MAG: hypothetical protein ACOCWO_04675 [Candidatus Muiribacteriaceae bacterium]